MMWLDAKDFQFKAMIDRLLEPRDELHDYLANNITSLTGLLMAISVGFYELYFFLKNFEKLLVPRELHSFNLVR